jgi:hypothetical protein
VERAGRGRGWERPPPPPPPPRCYHSRASCRPQAQPPASMKSRVITSVPDPDPLDPHVFWSPGSRSKHLTNGYGIISQRHGPADPDTDPQQDVMDPEYCTGYNNYKRGIF